MGRYLSRQRRLRGIGLDELAQATRIPLRSLERLEAGSFDRDADGFVRGFVRTVAQALGLDPDDTVARLLHEVRVADAAGEGGQASALLRAGWVLVAVALLAASVALWRALAPAASEPEPPAEPRLIYREDPVRALAEAEASRAPEQAPRSGTAPRP